VHGYLFETGGNFIADIAENAASTLSESDSFKQHLG
jgi:hypothetical protein